MIKIIVGTTSEQKIGYVKDVLSELGVQTEIIPVEVDSGISSQPMTSEETRKGSFNRAKIALEKIPNSDYGLGIEVGYEINSDNKYEIFCWSTIISIDGKIFSSKSNSFVLPKFHQDILKKGLYLGDFVREYFKTDSDQLNQIVAEDIRGRKPYIVSSLRPVLIYIFKKEEY